MPAIVVPKIKTGMEREISPMVYTLEAYAVIARETKIIIRGKERKNQSIFIITKAHPAS